MSSARFAILAMRSSALMPSPKYPAAKNFLLFSLSQLNGFSAVEFAFCLDCFLA